MINPYGLGLSVGNNRFITLRDEDYPDSYVLTLCYRNELTLSSESDNVLVPKHHLLEIIEEVLFTGNVKNACFPSLTSSEYGGDWSLTLDGENAIFEFDEFTYIKVNQSRFIGYLTIVLGKELGK